MEYRVLGRSGLKVSVFSFGAMTFGGTGRFATAGKTQLDDATRQVDMCLDAWVNLFDTSDSYSAGESERLLGQALGARRASVLIATKCYDRWGTGPNDVGASRFHIIRACEASLRRLNSDYIDIYQIHIQDLIAPPEETLRALDDLVRAGKVRYIGSSNHSGWTKMRALATSDRLGLTRYVSQQIQYSLLKRDAEDEFLPLGVHEGVGALIWGPLAGGYLSGKFLSGADTGSTRLGSRGELSALDDQRARSIITTVKAIAQELGASMTQVALNWIARRRGVASIIVGARTNTQLAENLAAARWSLSDDAMDRLNQVSALPSRYHYNMHRDYYADRNPQPALLAPADRE